ncbi:MAG: PIN domain-containing protein [Acidobacteria bacterium]|nr:PIN domain-containing protein [Acidobacteriota bacterium]
MKMLVDTGALLALTLKRDQHHGRAATFARQHRDARFVLTDLILAETVTRLRARADARLATAAGRSLLESRRYEVLFVDAPLVTSALARLEQFGDKALSLTDCVSFEVMDRLGLTTAFAFDRDFRDCGYRTVP